MTNDDAFGAIMRRQDSAGPDENVRMLWTDLEEKLEDTVTDIEGLNHALDAVEPSPAQQKAVDRLEDVLDGLVLAVKALDDVEVALGIEDSILEPGDLDFDDSDDDVEAEDV